MQCTETIHDFRAIISAASLQIVVMMVRIGPLQHVHGDPEESGGEPTVHAPLHGPRDCGMAKIVTGAVLDPRFRQYARFQTVFTDATRCAPTSTT